GDDAGRCPERDAARAQRRARHARAAERRARSAGRAGTSRRIPLHRLREPVMTTTPRLHLGASQRIDGAGTRSSLLVPAHHLVTHGVVVGMTGSGKTGLLTVIVEEALRAGIPVLALDVKGDMPNLLLAFPSFTPRRIKPWALAMAEPNDTR